MSDPEDGEDFLDFTALPAVASPCISICRMTRDGLCEGCWRTLGEIAEWSLASDDRRREILGRIERNRTRSGSALANGLPR